MCGAKVHVEFRESERELERLSAGPTASKGVWGESEGEEEEGRDEQSHRGRGCLCQTTRDLGGLSQALRLLSREGAKQARLPELAFPGEPAPLRVPPRAACPSCQSFLLTSPCLSAPLSVSARLSTSLSLSLSLCVSVCPRLSLSVCICPSESLCLFLSLSPPLPAALRLVMVPASL